MPHVEAQACGKPVLSVDAMGIKETVIHCQTGFLVRPAKWISITEAEAGPAAGYPETRVVKFDQPKTIAVRASVDDLAVQALRLLTDDKLAARLGAAAREHAQRAFDYRDVARHVLGVMRERLPEAFTD